MKFLDPLRNYIILETPEKKTMIALPDGAEAKKEPYFVVVKVGPDVKDIKVGDNIVGIAQGMIPFSIEGRKYLVVEEKFIVSILAEIPDNA